MLKKFVISNKNASVISDPKTIWKYADEMGNENVVLYGFPRFYVADSANADTSETLHKIKRPNIAHFEIPVGTIYCTDGRGDKYTITDGLDIANLDKDADKEHLRTAIDEITARISYAIGDSLTHAEGGTFNVISKYYNNLLTQKDMERYEQLFTKTNGELHLSEEGNQELELFKQSWDSLPEFTVKTCKLNLKPYLIEFYKELKAGVPPYLETIESFVNARTVSKDVHEQAKKDIQSLEVLIREGILYSYLYGHAEKMLEKFPHDVLDEREKLLNILDSIGIYIHHYDKKRERKMFNETKKWTEGLNGLVNALKNEVNQLRGSGISARRQLELLERGDYVSLQEELDTNYKTRTVVKPGINFKYLDKVCDTFCPVGLADKYNTWKIRRLGSDLELIKYFKNVDGDLLRVSANTRGDINIGGNARQVFDEQTMNEINSIEKVLNYGIPAEQRTTLRFYAFSDKPQLKEDKSHLVNKKIHKVSSNKSTIGLRKSEERLLSKLRRY